MKRGWRKIFGAFVWIFVLISFVSAQTRSLVIKNSNVIDGTGQASFRGDVRIAGDRIIKIGNIKAKKDETVLDAAGKVLAPGFIDIHNHSESGLLREGAAANQVSQGVTTVLVGPDGGSPFPLSEYFAKLEGKIAPNVGAFIGHATLRAQAMPVGD